SVIAKEMQRQLARGVPVELPADAVAAEVRIVRCDGENEIASAADVDCPCRGEAAARCELRQPAAIVVLRRIAKLEAPRSRLCRQLRAAVIECEACTGVCA